MHFYPWNSVRLHSLAILALWRGSQEGQQINLCYIVSSRLAWAKRVSQVVLVSFCELDTNLDMCVKKESALRK